MEPIFNDDKAMLMLNTIHRLRKVLQREGRGYQSEFHRRIGVGLTPADFAVCVKMLQVTGCCSVSYGERDAVILMFNDLSNIIPHHDVDCAVAG
jgi:hypothetical protein